MDNPQKPVQKTRQNSSEKEIAEARAPNVSPADAAPFSPPVSATESIPQKVSTDAPPLTTLETESALNAESESVKAQAVRERGAAPEATQPASEPSALDALQALEVAQKIQEMLEIIGRRKVTGPLSSVPEVEAAVQTSAPAAGDSTEPSSGKASPEIRASAAPSKDANLRDTAVLPEDSPLMRRAIQHQGAAGSGGTANLGEQREVILLVRGMVERLLIEPGLVFRLGRFDISKKQAGEIDLTPYGALDRGVSRVHAQIHLEEGKLYITDLGSTNGTYLSGRRLEPNKPAMLRKGDELLLGRLALQVLFR